MIALAIVGIASLVFIPIFVVCETRLAAQRRDLQKIIQDCCDLVETQSNNTKRIQQILEER